MAGAASSVLHSEVGDDHDYKKSYSIQLHSTIIL